VSGEGVQRVEIAGLADEAAARSLMAGIRQVRGVRIPSVEGPAGSR
jgi:hypothetical protein